MHGKTVFITGGARRVGASICRTLHAAGAQLMIHYRQSATEARALQAELNALRPDSVALIQADLNDSANLPSLIQTTIRHFGRLDVLVHNASSFYPTPLGSIQETDWLDLMGSNLKAPLFLAQAASTELRRNKGTIIHIADIHGELPLKNYSVYSIAKAGLIGLTRSLARELSPDVRVNAVSPGAILWPESDPSFDDVSRQRIISSTLLKQAGRPEDIAETVLFLAAHAPYITGQILNVDGGRSIKI